MTASQDTPGGVLVIQGVNTTGGSPAPAIAPARFSPRKTEGTIIEAIVACRGGPWTGMMKVTPKVTRRTVSVGVADTDGRLVLGAQLTPKVAPVMRTSPHDA